MMIPSRRLRHRITIRRATEIDNGKGGYSTGPWEPVATVFAAVTGLDGRESVMNQVLQGVSVYKIEIRWRGDVRASDQLRSSGSCFGGRDVNITSAVDPDGRRESLVIIGSTAAVRS